MTTIDAKGRREGDIAYYGWVVTAMAGLANLVGYGVVFAFGVFLKPLSDEFGWTRSAISGAFSLYAILHNVLAFFTGQLTDRFGPRVVAITAGLFIGLATVLMALVNSIWQLYVFYGIILSFGIASNYAPLMATVARWFHEKRGFAIGITAGGVGASSLIYAPLSAWLITTYGWRTAYAVIGILSWLIFMPIVRYIQRPPAPKADAATSSVADSGLSFRQAFRTRTFWAYCFIWTFAGITEWAITVHIVPLVTDRGIPIIEASMVAAVMGVSSFGGRVMGGFFSDRLGRKRIFVVSLVVQLLSVIWMYFIDQTATLFLFAIMFGLGMGGWTGVVGAFPADYFGFRSTGTIIGFAVIFAGIGVALGPYLGGYFFDTTQSYDAMILLCIATTAVAIVLTSLLSPVKNGQIR